MELVSCKKCNHNTSSTAIRCPACFEPTQFAVAISTQKKNPNATLQAAFAIPLLLTAPGLIASLMVGAVSFDLKRFTKKAAKEYGAFDFFQVGGTNFLVVDGGIIRVTPIIVGGVEPFSSFVRFEIDEKRCRQGGLFSNPRTVIAVEASNPRNPSKMVINHYEFDYKNSRDMANYACEKFKEYSSLYASK